MASTSEEVKIKITGDNNSIKKALNEVQTSLRGLEDVTRGPINALGGLTNLMGIGLTAGISAAVYGFGTLMKQAIDTADEMNKMSQKIGVSVEFLSKMRYALDLSDVSMEQFQVAMTRLSAYMQENNITGNLEEQLLKIADQFSNAKDSSEKTAIALKYFGRSGAELIPLLNQGADGLKQMMEEAKALGLEISKETAVQAENLNDQMKVLKYQLEGIAIQVLPGLLDMIQFMVYQFKHLGLTIKAYLFQSGDAINKLVDGYEAEKAQMLDNAKKREQLNKVMEETNEKRKKEEERLKRINDEYQKLLANTEDEIKFYIMGGKKADDYTKELIRLQIQYDHWIKKFGEAKAKKLFEKQEFLIFLKYVDEMPAKETMIDPVIQARVEAYQKDLENFQQYSTEKQSLISDLSAFEILTASMTMEEYQEGFSILRNSIDGIMEYVGKQSESGFQLFKAYKKAEAMISAYSAAVKAYESLVGIPIIGPVLATAAAAAALAFGLAQVSMINSIQRGSGGGGSVRATAPTIPAVPRSEVPKGESGGKQVTINIYGSVVDHDKFARELIPSIRKAVMDGV
jgi:hypothetical protein